ncbi:hypothetical protein B0H11DRAFT_1924833 [Mycena galericulata]|nr:hypothetical protein B0H11DRAFT_1924833 [Mycena galericulata]
MAHYSPQKPLSHALSSSVPVSGDVKTEALITEATDMDATSDPIMEGANSSLVIGTSDAPVDIQAEVLAVDPDVKERTASTLQRKATEMIMSGEELTEIGHRDFLDLKTPRHSRPPPRILKKTSPPPSSSRTSSSHRLGGRRARTDSVPRPEDALTSPPAPACTQKDLTAPIVVADVELAPTWRYFPHAHMAPRIWKQISQPPSLARTRSAVTPTLRSFFCADALRFTPNAEGVRKSCGGLGDCAAHASPAARQNFHRHSPGSRPIRRAPPPPPAPLRSLRAPLSRSTTAGSVGDSAFGAPVTNRPKLAFFSYAGRRSPPPFSTGGDDENAVGLLPPLFLSFCRSPWFLLWTDTLGLTLSSHDAKKAEFFVKRAAQPFAREGPGSCYNVACVKDADIVLYRDGVLTGVQLLERMVWKVGHTNDIERRQGEYGRCDKGQTHIWRFAQLQQLCDGGELVIEPCPGCKRRHREYYDFRSVGGFKQFTALMNKVITTMGEVPSCVFFDRPSDDTSDIYDLILQS